MTDFQNVNCFVFERRFTKCRQCVFITQSKSNKASDLYDALFGNFAYLHNLYAAIELHTNFVLIHFGSQLMFPDR